MPRPCPDCLLPPSECLCDDDGVMFPANAGPLLASMLGPGPEPEPGPPYTHVLQPPPYPEEGEPYQPPPPSFTITRESE